LKTVREVSGAAEHPVETGENEIKDRMLKFRFHVDVIVSEGEAEIRTEPSYLLSGKRRRG